ncbi:MAG: hypothetical protein AUH92_04675 [Acidobacteria bacterium 13_1_40CM_4_69_4]|nr:MAG: hypothetical protein AUH92_04675 [Acidobacteria bacterium 13_1_40CM_4_69_4]
MAGDLVAREAESRRRQKPLQDPGGQLEVLLESVTLGGRQVVETVTQQRVPDQAIRLDRFVARLAQAEGPPIHPFQRRVHLAQQPPDLLVAGGLRRDGFQLLPPILELLSHQGLDRAGHHAPPDYFCFFAFCCGARAPEKV